MLKFSGKSVYKGIALGAVTVVTNSSCPVKRSNIEDVEYEAGRVRLAVGKAKEQLMQLYEKALTEAGEASAAIFKVYQMLLEDGGYLDAIDRMIRTERVNAEYAVEAVGKRYSDMFLAMEDVYMRERSADLKDISNLLIRSLSGQQGSLPETDGPSIFIAEDLSPSETVRMNKEKVLAFVTVHGTIHSHTAILARMMNIPALVGVPLKLSDIHTGMQAIVDGYTGEVLFEPEERMCILAEEKMRKEQGFLQLLGSLRGKDTVTLDGRRIRLCANIGTTGDVDAVLLNDADGIGLFRSEFLYMGKSEVPSEEEQFQSYKQVVLRMKEKKVIIRTLDIGVDKQTDYFHMGKEENPALGYRGIRICLKQPHMFKTQLRALLRAAAYGNLSVMYPMIISVEEVRRIYQLVEEAKRELEEEQVAYGQLEQGIMIETPAAVMISDELAELVDFFSIGTNDLTQYTLALDRQNEMLDEFYNPRHKAILRMIQMTAEHAHACGKWVGICGELASDLSLTEEFLRMGIDELSVAPSMVLKVRQRVRELDMGESSGGKTA